MGKTINLKRKKFVGRREIIVILSAIVLTTLGIKASDTLFSPQENQEITENSRCPQEMIFITSDSGGFCIDKYEASAGKDCPYTISSNQTETRTNLNYPDCMPVSSKGTVPWNNISQDQAALACAKAGKRLPTNKEWLQASLGTPDSKSNWGKDDCHVSRNWNQQPGLTGSGINCISSAGAMDMVGNLWEWVEGAVKDGKYKDRDLPDAGYIDSLDGESMPGITNLNTPNDNYNQDYFWIKTTGLRGIARGGYWDNESDAGVYSVYIVPRPSSVESGIGFRCAR